MTSDLNVCLQVSDEVIRPVLQSANGSPFLTVANGGSDRAAPAAKYRPPQANNTNTLRLNHSGGSGLPDLEWVPIKRFILRKIILVRDETNLKTSAMKQQSL